MQMIVTATKLDWGGWFLGLWTSAISASAGAVSAGLGPMVTDPKDFNLGIGLHHTLVSIGIGAAITGIVSLAKYLQMHPSPEQWDGTDRRGQQPTANPALPKQG